MKRATLVESNGVGRYFVEPVRNGMFTSGCTLLDCVLGGGWPLGRIVNIIGDRSTGKTLLAIEACANFIRRYPNGKIYYNEVEAAFDKEYAGNLGLPLKSVKFSQPCYTVEDMFADVAKKIEASKCAPTLYIVDSIDALSDRAEQKREMGDATYGANKAQKMSEMFRRINQKMSKSNMTFMVISQVRDKIGVTFGKRTTRSGGKALDFYASQILYLAQLKKLLRTHNKVQRAVGVLIRAKCEKNKVGLPFREADFPIIFTFGIDDVEAGVEWLNKVNRLDAIGIKKSQLKAYRKTLLKLPENEYQKERSNIIEAVTSVWSEIEQGFLPRRKKYSDDTESSTGNPRKAEREGNSRTKKKARSVERKEGRKRANSKPPNRKTIKRERLPI